MSQPRGHSWQSLFLPCKFNPTISERKPPMWLYSKPNRSRNSKGFCFRILVNIYFSSWTITFIFQMEKSWMKKCSVRNFKALMIHCKLKAKCNEWVSQIRVMFNYSLLRKLHLGIAPRYKSWLEKHNCWIYQLC